MSNGNSAKEIFKWFSNCHFYMKDYLILQRVNSKNRKYYQNKIVLRSGLSCYFSCKSLVWFCLKRNLICYSKCQTFRYIQFSYFANDNIAMLSCSSYPLVSLLIQNRKKIEYKLKYSCRNSDSLSGFLGGCLKVHFPL